MKSCAFTGHRPQNLPFGFREDDERCTALKETLKKQIISLITDEKCHPTLSLAWLSALICTPPKSFWN